MNLPHIHEDSTQAVRRAALGSKSLKAFSRPIQARRRETSPVVSSVGMQGSGLEEYAALPNPGASWRTLETQRKYLLNLPYSNMLDIALDLSPQINKGLFDFLRFSNPGTFLDGTPRAVSATKAFIGQMDRYYGSFKSHIDSVFSGIFLTGGFFPELVLNEDATAPVDIALNNPLLAKFRRLRDPLRGWVWELGQDDGMGGFTSLDKTRLVKYIGFDRTVDNPYGRPMVAPAVQSSLFLLGIISDLRRALANQGLSRIDYELQAEELLRLIDRNPDIAGDDEATAQFIEDQIDLISETLGSLDVDSDYVHLSTVKVNYATNPMQQNISGLDTIIDNLKIDVVNGFKGVAALSNLLNSTTETHGNLQVDFFVSAINSLQDEIGGVFTEYFDIGNKVQGIPSELSFQFKRQRAYDRKQFAEFIKTETETVLAKLEAGVISVNEARNEIDSLKDEMVVS